MKRLVSILLCVALAISVLCVNVSAEKTFTCKKCLSDGKAVRVCSGKENTMLSETVPCTIANGSFQGIFHRGICKIERHYCQTDYSCRSCGAQYFAGHHMCWVWHTSVEVPGDRIYYSVCSAYVDSDFDYNSIVAECAVHPHAGLSEAMLIISGYRGVD